MINATAGKRAFSSAINAEYTCASRWFTPASGTPRTAAIDFASLAVVATGMTLVYPALAPVVLPLTLMILALPLLFARRIMVFSFFRLRR